ncbi:MAG: DUF819 domain-containing protein [Oscillospiraceae bacterium]|nr:DUF819 domain-containing protein [Oscillospiraceae bacterium]
MESLFGTTLITADNTWGLLGMMCITVALSIWLEQTYNWASKVSGAIIALIIAMFAANIGIIPVNSPLYDDIVWGVIVPMGIPLLLLQCNLNKIGKLTGKMLVVFVMGAAGTTIGALIAFNVLKGAFVANGGNISDLAGVASMMTGSYIGGGVNFAAMADAQGLKGTDVAAAATVADNLLMAAYFFVLIFISGMKWFRNKFSHPHIDAVESGSNTEKTQAAAFWNRKEISLKDIAFNIAYAVAVVWASNIIAGVFTGMVPAEGRTVMQDFVAKFFGSQYVWITTISVIVATFFTKQIVSKMNGSQEIGTYLIYLFLFVIGVPANIMTVIEKSPLFLVLCFIMVCVNMLFCFIGAKLCKATLEDAIIASNANIGGPTTAAGMAISQGWTSLVGPAMLVGVLGYVIGNYLGTLVGIILGI